MEYKQTLQGLCLCVNDSYRHYNAILHRLLTQFCKKKKSGQLEVQDAFQGNHMAIFTITIIFI